MLLLQLNDVTEANARLRSYGSDVLLRSSPSLIPSSADLAKIRAGLPMLRELAEDVREASETNGGIRFSEDGENALILARIALNFAALQTFVLERLRDLEDRNLNVPEARDYRAALREISTLLSPVTRMIQDVQFADLPLPSAKLESQSQVIDPEPSDAIDPAWEGDPVGWALEQMSRTVRGTRVTARLVAAPQISAPIFESDESPELFELPILGDRQRVKTRPGRIPLPDPIDFEGL